MKNLKTHLAWLVITLLLAAGLVRSLAHRGEEEPEAREKKLRSEIRDLKVRLARAEGQAVRAPDSASPAEASEGDTPAPDAPERRTSERRQRKPLTPQEISALLRSTKRDDRRRALREIERMKDKVQKVALLREAVQVGDSELKYRAVAMFDEVGKPESTMLAMEILQGSEEPWLRARAARELSQIQDPSTFSALQSSFQEQDSSLKYWSAKALQALGYEDPVRELVAATSSRLNDPDGAVREDGVERLGDLGSADALPHLNEALRDPNSRVRREALQALGNTNLGAAVPIIRKGLGDPRGEVREAAVEALLDIGTPEVIPILQTVLNDSDRDVVRRAERAISRLQNPRNGRNND